MSLLPKKPMKRVPRQPGEATPTEDLSRLIRGKSYRDFPFRVVLSLGPLIEHLREAANSERSPMFRLRRDIDDILSEAPELEGPIEDMGVIERNRDRVEALMSYILPPTFWDTELACAMVPFFADPFFVTPAFRRLFLSEDGKLLGRINVDKAGFVVGRLARAYLMVLRKYYGVTHDFDYPLIRAIEDPDTGLERRFRLHFDSRFFHVSPRNQLPELSEEERIFVFENLLEPERIMDVLPPKEFEFFGFTWVRLAEVTETETMSELERDIIDQEDLVSPEGFARLQHRLRVLMRRPGLVVSLAAIHDGQVHLFNEGSQCLRDCIFAHSTHVPFGQFSGTLFERAIHSGEMVKVPDVDRELAKKCGVQELQRMGVRSLLIAPLKYEGRVIGSLNLGYCKTFDIGPMDTTLVAEVQPLFSMVIKRILEDMNHQIQGIIQEKCTAIHPIVEWRFRQAAARHLKHMRQGKASEIEPIVFRDVTPLYGASDIRGSSEARNRAIQQDLSDHLELAKSVLDSALNKKRLPILEELASRVTALSQRIARGLNAGEETSVVRFLHDEVESEFPQLERFGEETAEAVEVYHAALDPRMGTIYRRRKDFEESVRLLNDALAVYLDEEEARIQALCPHFFERHRTDGVDYVVYAGASLVESGEFSTLFLKNLRLWQLEVARGMAVRTERLKPDLPVPLDTAHLILVQDAPLSVRFRYDEKRFDVDGAYDVRHEIVKSRLDKAVLKGTEERLTQPRKIAVVYSTAEEREEMLKHISFLQGKGLLGEEVESLEIEDLAGVSGLKALRLGVVVEGSSAPS